MARRVNFYGPDNPEPPYKMLGTRRVIDTVKLKQQQDAQRAAQVASSAPVHTRAGHVPASQDVNSGLSVRMRSEKARCMADEVNAPNLDHFIEAHYAQVERERQRDARYERERLEQAAERERTESNRRAQEAQNRAMAAAEKSRQARETESALFAAELEQIARSYGLSDAEIRLVQQRIAKAGHTGVSFMIPVECERYIADRKAAGL